MTIEALEMFVGGIVSALFLYVPMIANWYYKQSEDKRRIIMAAVVAGAALLIFGVSCKAWNIPVIGEMLPVTECSTDGLVDFAGILIKVALGNQLVFKFLPRTIVSRAAPNK